MGSTINQRLNNIDAFIKNVDARARNAQARRLSVQYTPLVKTNGQQIRNFPCTFETVDYLTGMSTRRSFLALKTKATPHPLLFSHPSRNVDIFSLIDQQSRAVANA
ncbi:hypothetical protein FPRO06_13866 [Fusarium proliferatum]|nr:hypothetical protein FPRO06_13866 [Fusarium proliferatum]